MSIRKIITLEAAPAPVTKDMVIKMVNYYRKNRRLSDKSSLKFAHIPLTELLELFVANNIIDPLSTDQHARIVPFGIKVYMANHADDLDTCPDRREDYRLRDTVIVCNTELKDLASPKIGKIWRDMLSDNVIIGSSAGTGLDKSTICPPDCPGKVDSMEDVSTIED
ncbi:hypothetical protein [Mucilaginibacter ginsenosidivorans]|uniref:Uncharacterized protein n=1 Tax=Mucilaginibacter ginsenosidivorans TaxID=398053 RepID=A0A5B8UYJ2_9SPHI|nr:hypothetical protein [Mucilaginibacter ginsenosidivorans]QEC63476.1 hypothetical protein FRZ54_13105 [Mucilaginibacter ginsenosidivorans]